MQEKQIPLRKVDIKSWDSQVARQHGIDRLPTLWLYKDRQLVTRESQAVFQHLSS